MVMIIELLGNTLVNTLLILEKLVAVTLCTLFISLTLTGTTFAWFSLLAPNSIQSWNKLENKFNDHFCSGDNETKFTDLTSVEQGSDESVTDYFKSLLKI